MLVKLVEQYSSQQFPALFSVLLSSYMGTKNQKKNKPSPNSPLHTGHAPRGG